MAMQVASLFASIGAETSGLEKGLSSAREGMQDLAGSMKASGSGIDMTMIALNQAFELAGKVSQAMQKVIEFSKEGAQIQRLADTSSALAKSMGLNMGEIVRSIQQASLGMVSEYDVMQSASRAMMLGVGNSAEQLGQLMEAAAIRGRAMGISTTQAFNDIITGIGRMSPQILDNLGIITDAEATYAAYADSIGKTAASLTGAEKKQALLNRLLGESQSLLQQTGGLTLDAAGSWEVMQAAQSDFFASLKTDASEMMTWWPEFWASVYRAMTPPENANQDLVDAMPILNDYLISGRISLDQYNEALGYVNNGLMTGAQAVDYAKKNFLSFYETNDDLITQLFNTSSSWEGFVQSMNDAGLDIGMLTEEIWTSEKALQDMGLAADNVGTGIPKSMQLAGDAITDLNDKLANAQLTLSVAIQTFYESVGESVYEGLKDAGLEGEELEKRLEFFDDLAGTDLSLKYKLEVETDQLVKDLLDPNFEANFSGKFAAFDDLFQPLISEIATAKADVDTLQSQIDALEGVYKIHFLISTSGTLPNLGGGRGGYIPSIEGEFASGGYGLSGQPYIVGEAGPELFIPDVNGRVYSNASSSAMMGGDNGDLLAALGKLPSASDIAMAVRDALLMAGA
jgi:hypothetical protein